MDEWPAMAENVRIELRFQGMCKTCAEQGRRVHVCVWISCPTGGWWSHREHPDDNHDEDFAALRAEIEVDQEAEDREFALTSLDWLTMSDFRAFAAGIRQAA